MYLYTPNTVTDRQYHVLPCSSAPQAWMVMEYCAFLLDLPAATTADEVVLIGLNVSNFDIMLFHCDGKWFILFHDRKHILIYIRTH